MSNRRDFLRLSALGAGGIMVAGCSAPGPNSGEEVAQAAAPKAPTQVGTKPIVISTWNHGMPANAKAFEILSAGGSALDAVEAGVMEVENDPKSTSVGYGGRPDREGKVTLDACIQNHDSDCGSVAFLQHIKNPIAVARKVMEASPHVMLVGDGALQFALEQGFQKENLLTEDSKKAWEKWLEESQYQPKINWENHDTIGMLAIDANGKMAGACTTSGAAYKLHGRVGDSPIIGAGLFIDSDVGGATATGLGEAMIRTAGSAMVVEQMRNGQSPEQACKTVIDRIISKHKDMTNIQVGFLAMTKDGQYGGYSVFNGFNFALTFGETHEMVDAKYDRTWD